MEKKTRITIGILAHVDAGKTTLAEQIMQYSGVIRTLGRVDHKDTYLDYYQVERERGITVFSKQAMFTLEGQPFTLLDTPGHVDFSTEMERVLQVLDVAILLVSAADGVQGHTLTLWRLLEEYRIPTFIFVNKMDQQGADQEALLFSLQEKLSGSCVDFSESRQHETWQEEIALQKEDLLEAFLEGQFVSDESILELIEERNLFPVYFGSALKGDGVEHFLQELGQRVRPLEYPTEFGARVFKVGRDPQNNRITYAKITGGKLDAKTLLQGQTGDLFWEEKVDQIRFLTGTSFTTTTTAYAGDICVLTGLTKTLPGQGLGIEQETVLPILEPVLYYAIELPKGVNASIAYQQLSLLAEEDPGLQLEYEEESGAIHVKVMGQVQLEILKQEIAKRFQLEVEFTSGHIVYKETIAAPVYGTGHFEPLRHYAEVHLLLEPLEPGSGLVFDSNCSEDILAKNWQRLILTHLEEKNHKGVLTGSEITDMKISLVAGKAHLKHTEGGDFRQATYRAVRQGLMKAQSRLLEPYFEFVLEIPTQTVGRVMTDLEQMHGKFGPPEGAGETSVLRGVCPMSTMWEYQKEVTIYTKGLGHLSTILSGYGPCHNPEEVMEQKGYIPELDRRNPTGSVFCAHGAGYYVEWDQVDAMAHVSVEKKQTEPVYVKVPDRKPARDYSLGQEELEEIIQRTFYANRNQGPRAHKGISKSRANRPKRTQHIQAVETTYQPKTVQRKEPYLLVDGYNIIFAWPELKVLAENNLDGARGRLQDILSNYQAVLGEQLILVFDAYRVKNHKVEAFSYQNIQVVFTKEAETADQYIEKFAHTHSHQYQITVATSDGLEQIIIRGEGCRLLSAMDLKVDIDRRSHALREQYGVETV